MKKIRWGILSTAKIGTEKVIPAMQRGQYSEITAIASRSLKTARETTQKLNIQKAYGSYEELLVDPEIEAVYIPLPNHLHVPWSIKALQAGKHVLCEKPIGLNTGEAQQLLAEMRKHPQLKVMEAFMYRFHPQWRRAKQIVEEGGIGDLRSIETLFSYFNDDPQNVRNIAEIGGGGLMDIGCYPISLSRFLFGEEPRRVMGHMEYDPRFKTDRLTSGILEFNRGTATFTCSTQLAPYQRVNILGTRGRIEIEIPFNAPPDRPTRLWHQHGDNINEIRFEICDQYTIQGDLFSKAVIENKPVPTPLEDALGNMQVIDKTILSAREGRWA